MRDADRLLNVKRMYTEFAIESENRKAIKFCLAVIVAVGFSLVGYALIWLLFAAF